MKIGLIPSSPPVPSGNSCVVRHGENLTSYGIVGVHSGTQDKVRI